MLKRIVIIKLILFAAISLKAQLKSNFREKIIVVSGASQVIDTLSIVPGSVMLQYSNNSSSVDSLTYNIDYAKSTLLWKGIISNQSVKITYKVFPILFSKTYFHKDVKLIQEQPISAQKPFVYVPTTNNTLFSLSGLNKSGSISRGIMFGNNQNLSLNSNMVMQLSGKIANDVEILAAISDDNLPIQPEGNTQQLNEFDKVFIQLKRDSTTLTAGDYQLRQPNSYFMKFSKRTQGGMLTNSFKDNKGTTYKTQLAMAVAKGRSARNSFNGIEGNQGPYRLTGNNGELYIVMLSGMERVYLDGQQLTRGQDNDYVVDYNTAELTFTTKRLITQNSRIIVEFEYSDKNYARSLTFASQEVIAQKTAFRFNYYNEKDNKNRPFLQDLTDVQKQFLAGLGSDISQAYYPNATQVEFNTNEVLYKQVPISTGGFFYQYSTEPQLATYRVGFSYVGEGKGNYVLNTSAAANGRVYEYKEPINGVLQGNYEPITLLVTPKKIEMFTLAADYKPLKNTLITSEIALSNNNKNLFADKGISNTQGLSYQIKAENTSKLNAQSKPNLNFNSSVNYEFVAKSFTAIERFSLVEFARDFNLEGQHLLPTNEHQIVANLLLQESVNKNIGYTLRTFIREGNYQGFLHKLFGAYQAGKYQLKYTGSILNANSLINTGNFYKQFVDVSRPINKLIVGLNFEQEHNRTDDKLNENLTGNSFSFNQYKTYLKSDITNKNQFKIEYLFREDKLPRGRQLLSSSASNTINAGLELLKNVNSTLNITAGYRQTNYKNGFVSNNNVNDQTLLGRIDYNLNAFKGFLNTNFYYETGNGQEPKREFTYLEVLPGQGVYAWIDYNNNGIKELDEFEVSHFPDQAKYIRIFKSTTDFVRTNFTGINQSIRLNPSAIFNKSTSITRFISRFTNQLSYKIDRKVLANDNLDVYNPFNTNIAANNLISLNAFFRNTLFFNRNNAAFGIDVNYQQDGSKIFLTNGFDTRNRNEIGLRLRSTPVRNTNLNLILSNGYKRYLSELFTERNYLIRYITLMPELNYQFSADLRTTFAGIFGFQKNDAIYGNEKNTNLTLNTETRYNIAKKGVLTAKIGYINNHFSGNSNSAIGYEMLSGLQAGNNLTWGLGLQRNIGNGVQLNLSYEGRKTAVLNAIHTGNMQVRAFF